MGKVWVLIYLYILLVLNLAFLEKLREESGMLWLLAELKRLMTILKFMIMKYLNYNNKIIRTDINNRINNLITEYNAKFEDIYNKIGDLNSNIEGSINNLEQYINNKIEEILNKINQSGSNISNEYKQYFEVIMYQCFKNKIRPGTILLL